MYIFSFFLFAQSSAQPGGGSLLTGFLVPMIAMVAIVYFIYKIITRILR